MLLHGDISASLSLSLCMPHSLCWANIGTTGKDTIQTQEKQESPLERVICPGSSGKSADDTGIEDSYEGGN